MPYYSPLRYPGGKRRLASVVMRLLEENRLTNVHYVEPFAGGAAIALALLLEEYATTVSINDLSRPVYAFWHSVLNDAADLCRRIRTARVTMSEWHRQRAVYDRRDEADLSDLGFATLFLNRTNRSGIISGGVIGGRSQRGAWSLEARFNKEALIHRIGRIARSRSRIRLYQLDAQKCVAQFAAEVAPRQKTLAFFDPPYIENGEELYLNEYSAGDHRQLADHVAQLKHPWVVTYDYAAVKHGLYKGKRRIVYDLHYSAHRRYRGREVMFLSDVLKVPAEWSHQSPVLMTAESNEYPLFGQFEDLTHAG